MPSTGVNTAAGVSGCVLMMNFRSSSGVASNHCAERIESWRRADGFAVERHLAAFAEPQCNRAGQSGGLFFRNQFRRGEIRLRGGFWFRSLFFGNFFGRSGFFVGFRLRGSARAGAESVVLICMLTGNSGLVPKDPQIFRRVRIQRFRIHGGRFGIQFFPRRSALRGGPGRSQIARLIHHATESGGRESGCWRESPRGSAFRRRCSTCVPEFWRTPRHRGRPRDTVRNGPRPGLWHGRPAAVFAQTV